MAGVQLEAFFQLCRTQIIMYWHILHVICYSIIPSPSPTYRHMSSAPVPCLSVLEEHIWQVVLLSLPVANVL